MPWGVGVGGWGRDTHKRGGHNEAQCQEGVRVFLEHASGGGKPGVPSEKSLLLSLKPQTEVKGHSCARLSGIPLTLRFHWFCLGCWFGGWGALLSLCSWTNQYLCGPPLASSAVTYDAPQARGGLGGGWTPRKSQSMLRMKERYMPEVEEP